MKIFTKAVEKSQAKYNVKVIDRMTNQGSYYFHNVEGDEENNLFKYTTEGDKKILIPDEDFEYNRKNEDGPIYRLNHEYTFKLGEGALSIIGKEFDNFENEFIVSKNAHNKFVIYRTVYYDLYKHKGQNEFRWFVDLFDNNISGTTVVIKIDEEKKDFIFDVELPSVYEFISRANKNKKVSKTISHNRIIFGAPGTGKSYKLNEEKSKIFGDRFERVTFHPNYSYSQFVGTYKPVQKYENGEKSDSITYEYIPGPFMRVYMEAYRSDEPYLLLIEEINRANVTSVFGDVFQLLDRKNGESEFEIETSEDVRCFLKDKMKNEIQEKGFNYKKLKIPSNMYIWATMNSADQGVFPMDTAFKRRWDFEYIGINEAVDSDYKKIKVKLSKDGESICWNDLRTAINNKLSKCHVNEDKLLGPYFISKETLNKINNEKFSKDNKFIKEFKSKILMYLFEDAGKHCNNLFSGCKDKSKYKFSSILQEFDEKGEKIFGDDILDLADDE